MEIHRADLAYRRRSLWLLSTIVGLCAVGLWQLHGWLQVVQSHVQAGDAEQARRWLRWAIAGVVFAPSLPLSLWGRSLRRLGAAAQAENRFPPREWKTYRDVRVLRDRAAQDWSRRTERMGGIALYAAGGFAAATLAAWFWLS
ncbi:hypothetical protein [Lysobacter gummosus]|uniref:Transmembrane protein n=1 Tax=Lysobacter gummosus TaxID=262324 RepID=A0ABY3X4N0_9GAMM|nr:hypothetical protein [Lysobacter gummosus]ALN91869.1 hypothetical protein LG3211_2905 [Lysobacter gummosus]UNP27529.1 hypothetical protein MOV92_13430 [Lysobacter gummosus]